MHGAHFITQVCGAAAGSGGEASTQNSPSDGLIAQVRIQTSTGVKFQEPCGIEL